MMTDLINRFVGAVDREYERRVRRASLVTEYGQPHHTLEQGAEAPHTHTSTESADVEITNIPRGAPVQPANTDDDHD